MECPGGVFWAFVLRQGLREFSPAFPVCPAITSRSGARAAQQGAELRRCGVSEGLSNDKETLLSAAFQSFQLIKSTRPVRAEKAREAAVGKHLAAGLASGAVIGFIVGIANALHFF